VPGGEVVHPTDNPGEKNAEQDDGPGADGSAERGMHIDDVRPLLEGNAEEILQEPFTHGAVGLPVDRR
jgi:hypothetical protein